MWKTIKDLGLEVLIKPVGRKWRLFIFWENSPISMLPITVRTPHANASSVSLPKRFANHIPRSHT